MDLKEKIEAIVNDHIEDESHFLVEVVITAKQGPTKIIILIDGDEGVNIDDCATLSRSVAHYLEENDLVDSKYTLEVSSPGVDYPLKTIRQYKKNLGREVKIATVDNVEFKGILKAVEDNIVLLDKQEKRGKKVELVETELLLENIKKTIVQISFK